MTWSSTQTPVAGAPTRALSHDLLPSSSYKKHTNSSGRAPKADKRHSAAHLPPIIYIPGGTISSYLASQSITPAHSLVTYPSSVETMQAPPTLPRRRVALQSTIGTGTHGSSRKVKLHPQGPQGNLALSTIRFGIITANGPLLALAAPTRYKMRIRS